MQELKYAVKSQGLANQGILDSYVGRTIQSNKQKSAIDSGRRGILDRFLHHAESIHMTGRSYRLKDRGSKDLIDKKTKE